MRILTPAAVDMLGKKLEGVIVKADGKYAVWVWWIYARKPRPTYRARACIVFFVCPEGPQRGASWGPRGRAGRCPDDRPGRWLLFLGGGVRSCVLEFVAGRESGGMGSGLAGATFPDHSPTIPRPFPDTFPDTFPDIKS